MIADEKDDLLRWVRREPGEEREALTPGALAVVRLAPVEVITHRHELDVRAQAPTVAKQPVRVEDAEEPLQGSLGITHGKVWIDSDRSQRVPPIPSNGRLVPGRSPSLFGSSDLHGSRSTGQRIHAKTRTSSIDGVELTLASPDTHDAAWVDYNEYILSSRPPGSASPMWNCR